MEISGKNFIGFEKSAEGKEVFYGNSPMENNESINVFTIATENEFEKAISLAEKASKIYMELPGNIKANFLTAISKAIINLGDELIEKCAEETALSAQRILSERGRTCKQLNMFSEILREGSWVDARIDTNLTDCDIRRMLKPIGPVAVFGASNFPLAFSVAGGDTVSSLAAGCPVIFKSHPSHPGTSEMVASAIVYAALETHMPEGVFSLLHLSNARAIKLVQHPAIKAVAFTGSREVGIKLMKAAEERVVPIPVFAEMSSINPVIILQNAINKNGDEIAKGLCDSINLGVGQFCTKPGLILLLETEEANIFLKKVGMYIQQIQPATMLNKNISTAYLKNVNKLRDTPGISVLASGFIEVKKQNQEVCPIFFKINAEDFLNSKNLYEEIFGPTSIFVISKNIEELLLILDYLPGQLTATIHASSEDEKSTIPILKSVSSKAGRIIWAGFPTGVGVCHAMQHGGPFPSTSNDKYTSVGSSAILRFVRPIAFQNFPEHFFPDELRKENLLKIFRLINGKWTKDSLI